MMVILFLYSYAVISSALFAILFCLYAFVYRPFIDFKRLHKKGLVTKEEFIKSFGFIRFNYYDELLFEK
jgi:pilus assembly protein TadC